MVTAARGVARLKWCGAGLLDLHHLVGGVAGDDAAVHGAGRSRLTSPGRSRVEILCGLGDVIEIGDAFAGERAVSRKAVAAAPRRRTSPGMTTGAKCYSRTLISRPVRSGTMAENTIPATGSRMPSAKAMGTVPASVSANNGQIPAPRPRPTQ